MESGRAENAIAQLLSPEDRGHNWRGLSGKSKNWRFYMAVGQNPGTPVNIPKTFKIDYLGRVIIPKKVP